MKTWLGMSVVLAACWTSPPPAKPTPAAAVVVKSEPTPTPPPTEVTDPAPPASPPPSIGALPDALDRTMIAAGVATVKPKISSCGDATSVKGVVKVSVKVAPSGLVVSVTVTATVDRDLGDCVAAAMRQAMFATTAQGGSFSYPFVF